jgi:hypothetical protein
MEEVNQTRYFAKKVLEEIGEKIVEGLNKKVEIPVEEEVNVMFDTMPITCEGEELKQMKELAYKIYEVFLDIEGYNLTFPITKIGGLCCEAILEIDPKNNYYLVKFKIQSSKILEEDGQGDYQLKRYFYKLLDYVKQDEFDKDTHILHNLIKIKFILSNLEYCHNLNTLTIYPHNINLDLLLSIFENPNVEMCCDKCSVCLTITRNKTKCNHSLCFICWEQIKIQTNEADDDYLPCPLCREDIIYIN